jgi:ATP diphosphatase
MESMQELLRIMAALRDPQSGCPWDLQQNFDSIAPYTVEEAYEVTDAIERGNMNDLREELGDLLLQVVFHAQMAAEQQLFDFDAVAGAISDKLVRRHPHVFAGETAGSAEDQHRAWEAHKIQERKAAGETEQGVLAGITPNLPALTLANKTGKRAARVGFDWNNHLQVIEKIEEEILEVKAAQASGDASEIEEEIGDLLLAVTNLARHLNVDPEKALRRANRKFAGRFGQLEAGIQAEQADWSDFSLDELEARWQAVKSAERSGTD